MESGLKAVRSLKACFWRLRLVGAALLSLPLEESVGLAKSAFCLCASREAARLAAELPAGIAASSAVLAAPVPVLPGAWPPVFALSFLARLGGGRADLFPLAPRCCILSRAAPLLAHPHLVISLSSDPTSFPFLHSSTRQRARHVLQGQEHSPGLCLPGPSLPLLPAELSCLRVHPLAGDTSGAPCLAPCVSSLAAPRGPWQCLLSVLPCRCAQLGQVALGSVHPASRSARCTPGERQQSPGTLCGLGWEW